MDIELHKWKLQDNYKFKKNIRKEGTAAIYKKEVIWNKSQKQEYLGQIQIQAKLIYGDNSWSIWGYWLGSVRGNVL